MLEVLTVHDIDNDILQLSFVVMYMSLHLILKCVHYRHCTTAPTDANDDTPNAQKLFQMYCVFLTILIVYKY